MTGRTTDMLPLLQCRNYIFAALQEEMTHRGNDLTWIEREREMVASAANRWARLNGFDTRVTAADVERIEIQAVGHSDYASKLALYMAEAVTQ